MARLITTPNLSRHDDIYERLIALQENAETVESLRIYARLILLLMNHIGDEEAIFEAIEAARKSAAKD